MIRTAGPLRPGRWSHAGSVAWRATGLVPVALVAVAEAAWISVAGGLLQEFALRPQLLGIPELAALVVTGMIAARFLGRRLSHHWPAAALALVVVAGFAGWLSSPTARDALGRGLAPAIAANPGGWVAGLAVLRGYAHARLPLVEGRVGLMLGLGVPGLAIGAIVGGMVSEPFRGRFLADELEASIVFLVAGMLALALTRLSSVGGDAGFDWRRNPTWLALTVALLAVAIVAAVPLSAIAGTAVETALAVAFGPALVLGLVTGWDRALRRVLALILVGGAILLILIRLFVRNPTTPSTTPAAASGQGTQSAVDQVATIGVGGVLLLAGILAVVVLAAVWMERTKPPDDDLVEESRTIDRGDGEALPRRPRRWRPRRPAPTGAAAAYVALLRELSGHAAVRREAGETPAEHAARLRSDGLGALSLDLLAADYALDRYGGLSLPEREEVRAIGRWRDLRRRLPRGSGRQHPRVDPVQGSEAR